jgi:pimeloyl-ACP methyl ester carboxylesterase
LLQAASHEVFAVTLTGLGELVHLATPAVDLHTHVEDVVAVLAFERLEDVVLVGHSYGGFVITGVADRVPERIAHLVFVDAFVPENGQTLMDLVGPDGEAPFVEAARAGGDGWRIPYDPPDGPETHRRTPLPLRTVYTPVTVTNPAAAGLARTFIACAETGADMGALGRPLVEAAARARDDPWWRYRELPTGHVPMETMPRELADLLLELA